MTADLNSGWRQVWYCRTCRRVAKAIPEMTVGCRCKQPVIPLRPTPVFETQAETPQARRLKALSEEEGRLRALARKGTKVRITIEAEVVGAMLSTSVTGQHLSLTVETPDGRRQSIDPEQAGLHIEAVRNEEEAS